MLARGQMRGPEFWARALPLRWHPSQATHKRKSMPDSEPSPASSPHDRRPVKRPSSPVRRSSSSSGAATPVRKSTSEKSGKSASGATSGSGRPAAVATVTAAAATDADAAELEFQPHEPHWMDTFFPWLVSLTFHFGVFLLAAFIAFVTLKALDHSKDGETIIVPNSFDDPAFSEHP